MKHNKQELDAIIDDATRGIRDEQIDESIINQSATRVWARVSGQMTDENSLSATAFALRYFEGYDNARIAQVLGTSQMVVAVTLHRARTRLRKEIGNYLEKHHEA